MIGRLFRLELRAVKSDGRSVVLLAAMIGSVVLARRAVKREWEKE